MPLRMLFFVFAACLGWFARGATLGSNHVAASAAATRPIEVRYPTIAIAAPTAAIAGVAATDDSEVTASDDSQPENDSAGDDIGELLAKAKLATATHNGVRGHVTDSATGAPVANVLVFVNRDDDHEHTITNGNGDYEVPDLDAGTYTVVFAYGSVSSVHENTSVSSFDMSTVDERIDVSSAEHDYGGDEIYEGEYGEREDTAEIEE